MENCGGCRHHRMHGVLHELCCFHPTLERGDMVPDPINIESWIKVPWVPFHGARLATTHYKEGCGRGKLYEPAD